MEPLQNGNKSTSTLQRVAIGAGAFIVVALTVVSAVFLAMQELPEDGVSPAPGTPPTDITQINPTSESTITPVRTPPTATATTEAPDPTNTSVPPPTEPAPTDTPPPPVEETDEPLPSDTPLLPDNTNTPEPPVATNTPVQVTATFTAIPAEVTNCGTAPPEGWVPYTVQLGDTFNSLATRTNISVFELQEANCLRDIQIGNPLYLPFLPPTPTTTSTPTPSGASPPTVTRTGTPIAPKISDVLTQQTDTEIIVIVKGENFRSREAGFRAELVGPTTITLTLGQARTSTNFEASAPIPDNLPAILPQGSYDLVVINPNGQLDTRTNVFPPGAATPTATPAPPQISQVSPSSGSVSEDRTLTIIGNHFRPLESGFKVELRHENGDLTVEVSVTEDSRPATNTSFDVLVKANQLKNGGYDLLVTNPNGQTAIEEDAYEANSN